MGYVLIIAEKHSQAEMYAKAFDYTRLKDGYYQIKPCEIFPKGAIIGYFAGHLITTKLPNEIDEKYKNWSLENLPIIPDPLPLKVIPEKAKLFQLFKQYVHSESISEVCIATDSGMEGEYIYELAAKLANCQKPQKRLWISSLTPDAIRKGFKNLQPASHFTNYHLAAMARQYSDYYIGINLSRAASVQLHKKGIGSHETFSIGRYQTALLKIIVDRELEIKNHVSTPFYTVKSTFSVGSKQYEGHWFTIKDKKRIERFDTKEQAETVVAFCHNKPMKIAQIKKERKEFQPPKLFNLSALQTKAGQMFKYSPEMTLQLAQNLYLAGHISYPRSSSLYITEEEAKGFPNILNQLSKHYPDLLPAPEQSIMGKGSRYINSQEIDDHHAIIPTDVIPDFSSLPQDERNIYDLVAKSVIAAHYPNQVVDYSSILTVVDEKAFFESKGKQVISEGWRKVFKQSLEEAEEKDSPLLPNLEENSIGITQSLEIQEGMTKPKSRFSESDLIQVMVTAGKYLPDGELEDISLLDNPSLFSIGQESTRAGFITTLKNMGYIRVEKHKVFTTPKGLLLIEALGDRCLVCSPELTAKWEMALDQIGKGKINYKTLIEQSKKLTIQLLTDLEDRAKEWKFQEQIQAIEDSKIIGTCPICSERESSIMDIT